MNKKKSKLDIYIEHLTKKHLRETLIGGFGFSKDDVKRLGLNSLRREASIETGLEAPEAPVKGSKSGSNGGPSSLPDLSTPNGSKQSTSKEPKEEKAKSKDWQEIVSEVFLYIKNASELVGDADGANSKKILDKLYDEVSSRFDGVGIENDLGVGNDLGTDLEVGDLDIGDEEDDDEEDVEKDSKKKKAKPDIE